MRKEFALATEAADAWTHTAGKTAECVCEIFLVQIASSSAGQTRAPTWELPGRRVPVCPATYSYRLADIDEWKRQLAHA